MLPNRLVSHVSCCSYALVAIANVLLSRLVSHVSCCSYALVAVANVLLNRLMSLVFLMPIAALVNVILNLMHPAQCLVELLMYALGALVDVVINCSLMLPAHGLSRRTSSYAIDAPRRTA